MITTPLLHQGLAPRDSVAYLRQADATWLAVKILKRLQRGGRYLIQVLGLPAQAARYGTYPVPYQELYTKPTALASYCRASLHTTFIGLNLRITAPTKP